MDAELRVCINKIAPTGQAVFVHVDVEQVTMVQIKPRNSKPGGSKGLNQAETARMKADDIRQLVSHDEGQRLEFKRSLAELGTATRTVPAFANTDGGVLLFGVRDSGEIIVVEIGQTTKERMVRLSPALPTRSCIRP